MDQIFLRANAAWDHGKLYSAFRLFLMGAKAESVHCQSSLGYFYENGIGVKKNVLKAIYWYEIACHKGLDSIAARNLALIYKEDSDFEKSKEYFQLAVNLGDYDALLELSHIAQRNGDFLIAIELLNELLEMPSKYVFIDSKNAAREKIKSIKLIIQKSQQEKRMKSDVKRS